MEPAWGESARMLTLLYLTFCWGARLPGSVSWQIGTVHLLRDVLTRLGSGSTDVQSACNYSLRRFLPSLAVVSRCPDSLALQLGNWVESVSLKHVRERQKGMHHHYADDKIATAVGSKSKLLQLLHYALAPVPHV